MIFFRPIAPHPVEIDLVIIVRVGDCAVLCDHGAQVVSDSPCGQLAQLTCAHADLPDVPSTTPRGHEREPPVVRKPRRAPVHVFVSQEKRRFTARRRQQPQRAAPLFTAREHDGLSVERPRPAQILGTRWWKRELCLLAT